MSPRLAARPKRLTQQHSIDALTIIIQNFKEKCSVELLPVYTHYYRHLYYSLRTLCSPFLVHYCGYGIVIVRKFSQIFV